ncbi:type II secretion system protein F [Burkholderia sp. WAC0059]|uniref:type II secretion system F family protein n=1 Tax=Burkholderia sp. WAC0059 TaxID=2066022 RepID=UPI000C7F0852|nr:type II secretion system F family protein [Burkholderia sp. WAC0059]PLZ00003.1 type II secretion system protein F [Burkholderia sp. WAC0059]
MALDFNRYWAKLQFTSNARLRVYRKIGKMMANGLPLLRVLDELELRASFEGRKPNEALAVVLSEWKRVVQNGGMLSEGMTWWVPYTEQMIIMAGEQSGRLEVALDSVTAVVVSGRKIRAAVTGGVAYPAAVLAMVIVYIYMFGERVIPQFAHIVNPDRWNGPARSLYLMSIFVQHWMVYCLIAAVVLAVLFAVSLSRWPRGPRVWLDRYPPYSIYRLVMGCSFLVAFASLLSSGYTVERSLMRLSTSATPWLRTRIDDTIFGVRSGLNAGEALKNAGYRFPSQEIVDDLCIYAEYNGFDAALKTLADEWMAEGVEMVTMQMRRLNGAAIGLLSLVIGWLVSGFFGIQQSIASMTSLMH